MQLLGVVVCQFGGVHLLLGGIDCSLSLAYLSLIGGVVNDKQHLSGTHRLTFFYIDLYQETLNLRTNLYVLHTLYGTWVGGLQVGRRRTGSHHGKFVIPELWTATAATA